MTDQNVTTTARAVLSFADPQGRLASFSIPRARLDKTAEEARGSMQAILASGALLLGRYENVTTPKSVKLVESIRTRIVS